MLSNKEYNELQSQLKSQEKELKEFNEAFQTQLKGKQDIIDNLTKQLATLKAEKERLSNELLDALEKNMWCGRVEQQFTAIKADNDRLRSALAEMEKEVELAKDEYIEACKNVASVNYDLVKAQDRIAELEKLCSEAADKLKSKYDCDLKCNCVLCNIMFSLLNTKLM